jgi:hypothetical protein
LVRTASNWRPVADRRRFATTTARAMTTIRQKMPNSGDGSLPSPKDAVSFGPNLTPRKRGGGTGAPVRPPDSAGFLNSRFSTVAAAAKVTMARFTPRTRNAGSAAIRPITIAATAPRRGPMGNARPACVASFDTVKPPIPAKAI